MSYDAAINELRQMLGDTEFHKNASKKKCLGKVDAENASFMTYDKRILEDTFQAFVNEIAVDSTIDDAVRGTFTLSTAPEKNTAVSASYYFQWWIDDEIKTFLNKGAEATGVSSGAVPDSAYLSIQPGLKSAALSFAASLAIRSLINFMMNRRHSAEFSLEQDGNDDSGFAQTLNAMGKQADAYWKQGEWHRDDFFKRNGARNAPAFGVKVGRTGRYGPNR